MSKKALVFAWGVEGLAVAMGLALAAFAGLEGSDSGAAAAAIAILPFAALSVVELTKIPLVALSFSARGVVWRALGMAALVVVTAATFENFVFGFERGFNERLRLISRAEEQVRGEAARKAVAERRAVDLQARQEDLGRQAEAVRADVAAAREQARDDLADARRRTEGAEAGLRADRDRLNRELALVEQNRLAAIRRCGGDQSCAARASQGFAARRADLSRQAQAAEAARGAREARGDAQAEEARKTRDGALAAKEQDAAALAVSIAAVRADLTAAQDTVAGAAEGEARARQTLAEQVDRSQLHRLSATLFGSHGQADLDRTKRLFVLSLSAIVALIGTVVATMHYAAERASAATSGGKVGRAIRAFYARRRRRLPLLARRSGAVAARRAAIGRALRAFLARRRRSLALRQPAERLKLIYLPLNATEREIATAREQALRPAPSQVPILGGVS